MYSAILEIPLWLGLQKELPKPRNSDCCSHPCDSKVASKGHFNGRKPRPRLWTSPTQKSLWIVVLLSHNVWRVDHTPMLPATAERPAVCLPFALHTVPAYLYTCSHSLRPTLLPQKVSPMPPVVCSTNTTESHSLRQYRLLWFITKRKSNS